jgi:hypothetical protein
MLHPADIRHFLTTLQPQQSDAIKRVWIHLSYVEGEDYFRRLMGADWSILSAFAGLERVAVRVYGPSRYSAYSVAARKRVICEALKQGVGEGVEIVFE